MNKADLITAVAEAGDLPRVKAGELVDSVFVAIIGALRRHEEVRLVGFGSFAISKRKGGIGRNPRTGADITIPETITVRFKAGKTLKEAVGA